MANLKFNKQIEAFEKKFNFKKLSSKVSNEFIKKASEEVKPLIVDTILKGASPVKGYKRFENYSPSYRDAIRKGRYSSEGKRPRPVNLFLTGRMLKSIKSVITKNGFTVWFTDKKAKYHNDIGVGAAGTIRKMLPGNGEELSAPISLALKKLLRKIVKDETTRLRKKG